MGFIKQITVRKEHAETEDILLRSFEPEDINHLINFFSKIPIEDLLLFEDDIYDPEVVKTRFQKTQHNTILTVLAIVQEQIVGIGYIIRRLKTRSSHIGEIRIYISQGYRHLGIGHVLLKELYYLALSENLEKLIGSVPMNSKAYFEKIAEKLGFAQEAVLKGYIKDNKGRLQDLVIYSRSLEDLWENISDWQSPYGRSMEY